LGSGLSASADDRTRRGIVFGESVDSDTTDRSCSQGAELISNDDSSEGSRRPVPDSDDLVVARFWECVVGAEANGAVEAAGGENKAPGFEVNTVARRGNEEIVGISVDGLGADRDEMFHVRMSGKVCIDST